MGASSRAWPQERRVLSAMRCSGVYPRESFYSRGFDEDFFAYMEDVDLDFRLQLWATRVLVLAKAVVRHAGSGLTSRALTWWFFMGTVIGLDFC
jgi:GT2 family glycosyltransferase